MQFLLSIVLSGLVLANVPSPPEGSPLSAIVDRYGGKEMLAEAEVLFQEGRRCTRGDCRDFRSYREGESKVRVEDAFSPPLWRVESQDWPMTSGEQVRSCSQYSRPCGVI